MEVNPKRRSYLPLDWRNMNWPPTNPLQAKGILNQTDSHPVFYQWVVASQTCAIDH